MDIVFRHRSPRSEVRPVYSFVGPTSKLSFGAVSARRRRTQKSFTRNLKYNQYFRPHHPTKAGAPYSHSRTDCSNVKGIQSVPARSGGCTPRIGYYYLLCGCTARTEVTAGCEYSR
jgi:hypothetical protein